MLLSEAREFIGKNCAIQYKDRYGNDHRIVSRVYDATYVPLYGGYLVTENDDIRFDRIGTIQLAGATEAVRAPACAHAVAA